MFTFTPLAGAKSDSTASQSLLELDGGIRILIDVGWDERLDAAQLKAIEDVTQTLSFILLTHPTIDHIGAYAHCCKHIRHFSSIPTYATKPVIALGRTLTQDLYASTPLAATVIPSADLLEATYNSAFATHAQGPHVLHQPPTAKEITAYFQKIESLEYSEGRPPHVSEFSPSADGLTITAFNAGHTLGGAIWHIQYGLESIVYAVDWNQAKHNILSGAEWLGKGSEVIEQLRRPTALVCSSKGAESEPSPGGRKKRDEHLLARVNETILKGGTVLIPTDSSARILELAYILEQHWIKESTGQHGDFYKSRKWALATKSANTTLRLASNLISWMDKSVQPEMTLDKMEEGGGPFDFKHVEIVERNGQLERLMAKPGPQVILASDKSLEWGFSKHALQKLCSDPLNLVILTERPVAGIRSQPDETALFQTLWHQWEQRRSTDSTARPDNSRVSFRENTAVDLEGEELTFYQQYLARQQRLHGLDQDSQAATKDLAADAAESESSSSSESENEDEDQAGTATRQGRALNTTASMTQIKQRAGLTEAELGVNILLRSKNVFDYDVRGKKGRDRMFAFVTRRIKDDEYGEVIGADEYLRAEERDEMAGQTMDLDGMNGSPAIGQKRKWGDVATTQKASNTSKRNKSEQVNGDASKDGQAVQATNGTVSDDESDDELRTDTPSGPRKVITTTSQPVPLEMGISFVDFSALHEKRDLHMLIPLLAPRKLILTAGKSSETEALAQNCKTLLAGNGNDENSGAVVLTPSNHETVDASVDSNSWDVKLSRELVKRLAWQHVKGLSVVAVTGRLESVPIVDGTTDEEQNRHKKLKTIEGSDQVMTATDDGDNATETQIAVKTEPVLDVVSTATGVMHTVSTNAIHVGDPRLADLRRLMNASNLRAEFTGQGTLLVEGNVIVRKTAGGTIEVEGSPAAVASASANAGAGKAGRGRSSGAGDREATFFAVRQRIYEGLAVVAGG